MEKSISTTLLALTHAVVCTVFILLEVYVIMKFYPSFYTVFLFILGLFFIIGSYCTVVFVFMAVKMRNKSYYHFSLRRYTKRNNLRICLSWMKWQLLRLNMFFIHLRYYMKNDCYSAFSRNLSHDPTICLECLWCGKTKNAIHTYTGNDPEPIDKCPKCKSIL